MRNSMSFDTTPFNESCEQAPYSDGGVKARKEAVAFIHQLKRQSGECDGVELSIMENLHDGWQVGEVFIYLSVEATWDDQDKEAENYVYSLETKELGYWDAEARKELGLG